MDGEGNPHSKIVLVGEGPGKMESNLGRPFVGLSGSDLNRYLLMLCGLKRDDVWITNIVRYRTDEQNSDPTEEDIKRDEPYLWEELNAIRPEIIVPVGLIATRYFLGPDANMEFVHALPHKSAKYPNAIILPVYHPASGLHQADKFSKLVYNSFKRLGEYLRGEFFWPPTDVETLYSEYETRWILPRFGPLAIDTEGTPKKPWGLSYSQEPGVATVARQVGLHIKEIVANSDNIILHNSLWDLPVLRAMGINIPYEKINDSMIMAHILCVEPRKLKALSYREAGMHQENYKDVIREAEQRIARTYLEKAASYTCRTCEGKGEINVPWKKQPNKFRVVTCETCKGDKTSWGQAPPQLVFQDDFTARIYQPQSVGKRLQNLLSRDTDLAEGWRDFSQEIRDPVEAVLGPMPEATLDDVEPRSRAINYSAADADATLRVYHRLRPRITQMGLEKAYEIDKNCIPIIDRMHQKGILINKDYFSDLTRKFESEQMTVLQKIHDEIGVYFNPASHVQIKKELAKLGLKDLASSDERTLKLAKLNIKDEKISKLIDLGLDYRELSKMKGTYTEPLPRQADENDRIHTTFILSAFENEGSGDYAEGPSTNRFSSRNPNLQNIPTATDRGNSIRAGFIARPGCKLLSVDLSQIELRVGAHLAREEVMIEAFSSGKDLHTFTAARMFNVPYEQVDKRTQRYPAKCFHPDTEVLTKTGWKKILDVSLDEEVMQAVPGDGYKVELEWAKPKEIFSQYHDSKVLIHLKNEGMDLRVTPDHRMLVWNNDSAPFRVVMPHQVASARGWANAGIGLGRLVVPNNLLRLAVASQADGSITESGRIRFGFSKARKIERLKSLLGEDYFSEGVSSNGKNKPTTWITLSKELSTKVCRLLEDKKFPWWWLDLIPSNREAILDEVQYWDSCKMPNWRMCRYSSSIKQNVEVLQAIASITNRKTRLVNHDNLWDLTIRDKNNTRGGSLVTTEIPFSDKVACISVPSTFILVRDGKAKIPVICGQTINFGIFYGMSEYRLQSELALEGLVISLEDARAFINAWFEAYPGIRPYMHRVQAEARQNHFVRTMFGHIRYLPNVHCKDERIKTEALRQAGNHPVQGSSGEILKIAMANIQRDTYPTLNHMGYFEPLLTIHDEIIFEVEESIAELAASMVSYEMENAVKLLVPLVASYKIADNWKDLK